jgi:thiamine biosynthesis lipoprotein
VTSELERGPIVEYDRRFRLFGSHVRLLIGEPERPDLPSAEAMGIRLEFFLRLLHRKLTRFDPGSEVCALNAAPGYRCRVSPTLATAVQAAIWAARRSDGLVDPTLVGQLEAVGYAGSRADAPPAPILEALARAPKRCAAKSRPASHRAEITVDAETCVVTRPPGVRIDTGGTGKGLAADLVADRLSGYATFAVDAGGDLRIGGEHPAPREVRIDHPIDQGPAATLMLDRGAVATSGLKTRLWRTEDGFAHHLLDPSTGAPAWTGVIQATSLGSTALEAETLAKMAFLSGPEGARRILGDRGGVLVLDDGAVELVGLPARSDRSEAVAA